MNTNKSKKAVGHCCVTCNGGKWNWQGYENVFPSRALKNALKENYITAKGKTIINSFSVISQSTINYQGNENSFPLEPSIKQKRWGAQSREDLHFWSRTHLFTPQSIMPWAPSKLWTFVWTFAKARQTFQTKIKQSALKNISWNNLLERHKKLQTTSLGKPLIGLDNTVT